MKIRIEFIVALIAAEAAWSVASADCICRARGQEFELGQSVCLPSAKGPRIATCGMVLNNTSWQFSETPCVVSQTPMTPQPAQAKQQALHAHHHGG